MTATVTSRLTAIVCLVGVLGLSLNVAHAQNEPLGDEFFFFAEGSNVTIPDFGGQIVTDPTNPANTVVKWNYANWSAPGWRWQDPAVPRPGIDMTANVSETVGEGDTLYFRIWVDPANVGQGGVSLAFFDSIDETAPDLADKDIEFRALWELPFWIRNGEWHDVAVPLPPATLAALDSAKAGKNVDGTDLAVAADTLLKYWSYPGGWVASVSTFVDSGNANFKDFSWADMRGFAMFFDNNTGGGAVYMDNVYIGGPDTDISVATGAPSAMGAISVAADGAENVVSWTHNPEFGGYNVYVSDAPITSLGKVGEVVKLGTVPFNADVFELRHRPEFPHPTLAGGSLYYAVTSTSAFGVENSDVSASASEISNPDAAVSPHIGMLTAEEGEALFTAVANGEVVPGGLVNFDPFVVDASHSKGGDAPLPEGGDADLSAKIWLGVYYDAANDINELYMYAEVTDDIVNLIAPNPDSQPSCNAKPCGRGAWEYDSIEMNWGSYDVPWLVGSTHTSMTDLTQSRGAEPDYQLRWALVSDGAGGITNDLLLTQPGPNGHSWEYPSHQPDGAPMLSGTAINGDFLTDGANTVGYKMLAVTPFAAFIDPAPTTYPAGVGVDVIFEPPTSDGIRIVPFNLVFNDADTGTRESQMQWSIKPNAGGGSWSNPLMWTVAAVAGRDLATSIDEEGGEIPVEFALDQNYPNPFNPSTTIRFALASTENVSLTVYDVLGREVMTLINNQTMSAGRYRATFDAEKLASGMYVYRLNAGSAFVQTKTMILVK